MSANQLVEKSNTEGRGPFGVTGASFFDQVTPAMSRWAQCTPSLMKRWMNWAAVMAPPSRSPRFFHVRDFRVDLLVVRLAERHAPDRFADRLPCFDQSHCERIVVGEETRILVPQRDHDCAGERRKVDDGVRRARFLAIPEHIGENEPPSASVLMTSAVCPDIVVTTSPGR